MTKRKRILVAFNQLQDFTITPVTMGLLDWGMYYANHKDLSVDFKQCKCWGFQRNFNEFMRYGIENEYDYIFQYDSDMTGSKHILERLVAHDKEAVGCLYYDRSPRRAPQAWNVTEDEDGDFDMFYEIQPEVIRNHTESNSLLKTDVRASGFTLFKTEALKQFEYPYGVHRTNKKSPYDINGFDMDLTRKFSKKFGGVYTDCSLKNEVKHITFQYIDIESGMRHQEGAKQKGVLSKWV